MTKRKKTTEPDSAYFFKLVIYLILGSQWLFLVDADLTRQIGLPLGLTIGLLLARHEHFQIDRKIEYAILLVATLVGYWANIGVFITAL